MVDYLSVALSHTTPNVLVYFAYLHAIVFLSIYTCPLRSYLQKQEIYYPLGDVAFKVHTHPNITNTYSALSNNV